MSYSIIKEVEVDIDAQDILDIADLDIELLADLIAQGDNMDALEMLNRRFPQYVRPPQSVLRLVRDRGHKAFEDKMVKQ